MEDNKKINRMEATDKIETILSWIYSCERAEQLITIKDYISHEYNPIPEELKEAIWEQKIEIIKAEILVSQIPTLMYYL